MSRVQKLRVFISQRLNAALEEILAVFEKTIVKYEQEAALSQEVISRQHALLCALHKPLMEVPAPNSFAQQLMVSKERVQPEHQDQDPQPSHAAEEQGGEQHPDPEQADIIQFTYETSCGSRPEEELDRPLSEAGSAGPDQDVQLVLSSETEDSDDYSKDSEPRSVSNKLKPKTSCGPGLFRCRVCNRTFKTRGFLFRDTKAHLQEPDQVCGLCGKRFQTADGLRLHIQTHQSPGRRREQQNQTRTESTERPFHQRSNFKTKPRIHEEQNPKDCENCEKSFPQEKKSKHRCWPQKTNQDPQSPD